MTEQRRPAANTVVPGAGERRRARLDRARLYLVMEGSPRARPVAELLEAALAGGVDVVQLRDKHTAERSLVEAARLFRARCDEHGALFVLNDRPELALECGADGVHVGQDDASVDEARALLGADALVGISTHSARQIADAERSLADYLAVGPVYATPTKPGVAAVGEALVRHAAERAAKPFFAIGGIDANTAGAVVAAGARRIAVVRAIRDARDPEAAARSLRKVVEREAASGAAR